MSCESDRRRRRWKPTSRRPALFQYTRRWRAMLASADAVFLKERRRRTSRSVGSSVLQKQCLCSSRPEFRTVAQRRRSLNLPVVRQQRRRANALVTEAPSSALPRVQPPAGPSIWEVVFSRELGFPFLAAPAAVRHFFSTNPILATSCRAYICCRASRTLLFVQSSRSGLRALK